MTDHVNDPGRCPSCDTTNAPDATFCHRCGRPIGTDAVPAPAGTYTAGALAGGSTMSSAMIGAITVAVVLVVGGTLFFVAGGRDDGRAGGAGEALPEPAVASIDPSTVPATTVTPPTTDVLPTVAPTTVAPSTDLPTTVAPTTVPPTVAPPPTPAPTTAAPRPTVVIPSTAAPVPTVAPGVGAVTFDEASAFFRAHIATAINGDYVTAWNMLSARDQADYERGFDQFVGFWQGVSFAEVQDIRSLGGGPSFQSMRVDMAYGQADGDPTSFEVIEVDVNVRPDGLLQIFDYRFIGTQ